MTGLREAWSRFTSWYRSAGRAAQIGIGCGALIIVCICATLGLAVIGAATGGGTSSAPTTDGVAAPSATATQSPAVAQPTATKIATQTLLPTISAASPMLGGSWQAFDKHFGDSNCCYHNGWEYQGPYTSTWTGVYVNDVMSLSPADNPAARVTNVQTMPYGTSQNWNATQVQGMQTQFMPPDAKLLSTKPVYLGNLAEGTEKTYDSVILARTLPASDFKNQAGKATAPGTIYVYFAFYNTDSTQFDECSIGTDESLVLTDA